MDILSESDNKWLDEILAYRKTKPQTKTEESEDELRRKVAQRRAAGEQGDIALPTSYKKRGPKEMRSELKKAHQRDDLVSKVYGSLKPDKPENEDPREPEEGLDIRNIKKMMGIKTPAPDLSSPSDELAIEKKYGKKTFKESINDVVSEADEPPSIESGNAGIWTNKLCSCGERNDLNAKTCKFCGKPIPTIPTTNMDEPTKADIKVPKWLNIILKAMPKDKAEKLINNIKTAKNKNKYLNTIKNTFTKTQWWKKKISAVLANLSPEEREKKIAKLSETQIIADIKWAKEKLQDKKPTQEPQEKPQETRQPPTRERFQRSANELKETADSTIYSVIQLNKALKQFSEGNLTLGELSKISLEATNSINTLTTNISVINRHHKKAWNESKELVQKWANLARYGAKAGEDRTRITPISMLTKELKLTIDDWIKKGADKNPSTETTDRMMDISSELNSTVTAIDNAITKAIENEGEEYRMIPKEEDPLEVSLSSDELGQTERKVFEKGAKVLARKVLGGDTSGDWKGKIKRELEDMIWNQGNSEEDIASIYGSRLPYVNQLIKYVGVETASKGGRGGKAERAMRKMSSKRQNLAASDIETEHPEVYEGKMFAYGKQPTSREFSKSFAMFDTVLMEDTIKITKALEDICSII